MPKKKIAVGDRVLVSKGEGNSIEFEGVIMKFYENSVLVEIDDSKKPNPITILNLPNSFIVVRKSLCTSIDSNGKELKEKASSPKNTDDEKTGPDEIKKTSTTKKNK